MGRPVLDAPQGRRDEFVEPYFRQAKADQLVVILKAREPARILTAIGRKKDNRWHLNWLNAGSCSTTSTSTITTGAECSFASLPTSLFRHAFVSTSIIGSPCACSKRTSTFSKPPTLSFVALTPSDFKNSPILCADLLDCARKWLNGFTPFFTEKERKQAGCQHRLFFAQVEYCDSLIFHRRAALDALGDRLLDANRTIGQPNKITMIFGRKITQHYRGKLQTVLEDLNLPNPVIRSHYGHGFIKQYVRDHLLLRTEPPLTMSTITPSTKPSTTCPNF